MFTTPHSLQPKHHILITKQHWLTITLVTTLGFSTGVCATTVELVQLEELPILKDQTTSASSVQPQKNVQQSSYPQNRVTTTSIHKSDNKPREKKITLVAPSVVFNDKDTPTRKYALKNLLASPQVFNYHINQVIASRDFKRLEYLLPYYKTSTKQDLFLVEFAQALLYENNGAHAKAINIYKKMLARDPALNPVRLHLATSLMKDKQYQNAKNQFLRLRSERLPKQVLKIIEANLKRIDRIDDWSFSASGNYVHDKNINNVPTKKIDSGLGSTPDPIEAKGIRAYIGAYKKFYLIDNLYTTVNVNASGNTYWNVDGYNDYSLTGGTAIGYMNSKTDVAVKPSISKRIYDNKQYNTKYGVELSAGHWVDPKLRLSASSKYEQEAYDDERNTSRDSDNYQIAVSSFYTHTAREYFYGGMSKYRSKAKKSPIISYNKKSAYVGWGKEWTKGLSSKLTARYSHKKYDDPAKDSDLNLPAYYSTFQGKLGSRRTDISHSVTTELWKRDYDIAGLTPKLVIDYDQTNSNFSYYDDKESLSGTVQLSKSF